MDARMQFEWSGEKAKKLIKAIEQAQLLGPDMADIVDRDDADYEIRLSVTLKHKRKSRKKSNGPNE